MATVLQPPRTPFRRAHAPERPDATTPYMRPANSEPSSTALTASQLWCQPPDTHERTPPVSRRRPDMFGRRLRRTAKRGARGIRSAGGARRSCETGASASSYSTSRGGLSPRPTEPPGRWPSSACCSATVAGAALKKPSVQEPEIRATLRYLRSALATSKVAASARSLSTIERAWKHTMKPRLEVSHVRPFPRFTHPG